MLGWCGAVTRLKRDRISWGLNLRIRHLNFGERATIRWASKCLGASDGFVYSLCSYSISTDVEPRDVSASIFSWRKAQGVATKQYSLMRLILRHTCLGYRKVIVSLDAGWC